MENLPKKRKLVLNRETVIPLQPEALATVIGGEGQPQPNSNLASAIGESAGASAGVSGVVGGSVSLVASESTSGCVGASAAVSGASSAVTSAVDHVSNRLGLPCWAATSLAGASVHFARKW